MNLLNLVPVAAETALRDWLSARGEAAYRLRQLGPRLWQRPVVRWTDASELPRSLAAALDDDFPLPRLSLDTRQVSADGTIKFLWRLPDGQAVESVLIPEGKRQTLCVSSQAGCAFGCVFCATGRMGFVRHLEPWEIAAQVREMSFDPEWPRPTNVVFMGMGEPLHNWDAVDVALSILNSATGCRLGARHITVSTVGVLPNLAKLAQRPEQFRLAVSLHAPTTERRLALMPVERKWPLDQLMAALRQFTRRVTFEYVMIRDRNDTDADAEALARLARPLGALVNLLPLHPGGTPGLEPTPAREIKGFAALLRDRGVRVSIRRSRGLDIKAACGQLRVEVDHARGVGAEQHARVE